MDLPTAPDDSSVAVLRLRVAELKAEVRQLSLDLADARAEAELADNMLRRRNGWPPVIRDWSQRSRR